MRRLFNDDKLQQEFDKQGYVKVPFIPADKVEKLKQLFFDTLPESGGQIGPDDVTNAQVNEITYDFTFIDKNPEYKRKVYDIITKEFEPQVNNYLASYKPIIANYIRKKTDAGEVPLHQNWSFADEHKCTTVSIWCPLVDSTVANGTLQVVPGSHKRFGEVRGPMVPWELDNIKNEIIEKHLVPLETKAGEAIILDDSIIHYSAINKTPGLRLAIQLILIPGEMPSWHYYKNPTNPNSKVEVCEVDVDFYMEFNPWKFPEKLKVVNSFEYNHRFIDEAEFVERMKQPRFDEPRPAVFLDEKQQKQFERDGYVVVKVFDEQEADKLSAIYNEVQPQSPKGFSSTIYNPDVELKLKTSERIKEFFQPKVDKILKDYRPLGSSFLCKSPGNESFMPVHQDWTIVNENIYDSMTLWVPLVDTDETNGAMKVLPGSHNFSKVLRAPTLHGAFTQLNDEIYKKMQFVKLKKGEGIIFTQALLHASPANLSGKDRVAATYGFVHKNADLRFYHRNNETQKVEEYKIPDDFFLRYNNIGGAPEFATKTREFDYQWKQVTSSELSSLITKHNIEKSKSIKMKKLFKDPAVQQFFETNGYVRIPMLGAEEVKELVEYYNTLGLVDHSGYGFNMSMEDDDKEKVARIRKKIFDVALPKALPHLDNPKVIAGSYVVKEHNPQGVVPPHQDWSFADNEGEYYSVTCWIPLVDTTLDNGAMGVIKGSHRFFDSVRPSPSPQVPTPLAKHLFSIFPYLDMYEMKAGEALIFDHRTFHASTPNVTDQKRLAIGLGFTQGDATICHYTLKLNGKMDTLLKYYVDDDFLLKYDNSRISKMYDRGEGITGYEIAEELPYVWPALSTEELVELIKGAGNEFNVPLCERMAKLFNYNMDGSKQEEQKQEEQQQPTENQPVVAVQQEWIDDRPFFKKYTPLNIVREIKKRVLA